jgi:hypothetical protein
MRKKILFSVGVIALITASGVAYAAYAYQGDPDQRGSSFLTVRHEAIQRAFKSNDYNAWKESMEGRGRVTEVINEGNFPRFSEMHQLMLEGKYDEANKIREELGLRQVGPNQLNGGQGNRGLNNNRKEDGNYVCPRGNN